MLAIRCSLQKIDKIENTKKKILPSVSQPHVTIAVAFLPFRLCFEGNRNIAEKKVVEVGRLFQGSCGNLFTGSRELLPYLRPELSVSVFGP